MKAGSRGIWDFIPLARGKRRPAREDVLASRPERNSFLRWYKEEGEVNLFVPRKKGRFGDLVGRLFRLPDEKQVVLDRVGSGVWELCDGLHSVENILDFIQRRHKLSRREAEVSVSAYLKILAERRFIAVKQGEQKTKKCRRKEKS